MSWEEAKLQETLSQVRAFGDDTALVECKTAGGGVPETLGESLCAFANMPQTGTIILGVDQRKNFAVTGVDNPAHMIEAVTSLNRNSVDPAPQLDFSTITIDGKHVVIVEVTPLSPTQKPAMYRGKPYLRQGDGDYVMNPNDLRMLAISALTESDQREYDYEILPGTDVDALDQEVLQKYLATTRAERSRMSTIDDDARLLQITNVTDADGNLRLAGLYSLGYLPQSTEPALGATAAVRLSRGTDGQRTRNLKEIEGPIPVMLRDAMEWIRQNTSTTSKYNDNGDLVDMPEFPPSAIREVLANALVHRDLGPSIDVGKKVEIRIEPNKLVITNPGGLRGLSVEQLEGPTLTKAAVNKRLYEIARYLRMPDGSRVIEGEGGGIREAITSCRESRVATPRFINTGVQFTVLFPRGSRFSAEHDAWLEDIGSGTRLSPTEEDLLVNLRIHGSITMVALQQLYSPLSKTACTKMVRKLEQSDLVSVDEDEIRLAEPPKAPESTETSEAINLQALGKNVPRIYQALSAAGSGLTVNVLAANTGLSTGQVRYGLAPLLRDGIVTMEGGQGDRATVYQIVQPAS